MIQDVLKMLLEDALRTTYWRDFFFLGGGPCVCLELAATVKNQSEQSFEDTLMTSSVSEYKTSAVRGGVENSFKTAARETHYHIIDTHTPAETKMPLVTWYPVHEQRLFGLNMTTSQGVIMGLENAISPCLVSQF